MEVDDRICALMSRFKQEIRDSEGTTEEILEKIEVVEEYESILNQTVSELLEALRKIDEKSQD